MQGEELQRAKQRAAAEWLKHQEQAGIDIVTDGEQFRIHFVHGFLEQDPCTNCGMAPIPYVMALRKLRSLAAGAALVRHSL